MLPVPSTSGTFSVPGKGGPPAGLVVVDVGVVGLLRSRSALADGEMVCICEDRDNDGDITGFVEYTHAKFYFTADKSYTTINLLLLL